MKMRMRTISAVLAVLVCLSVVCAGCGTAQTPSPGTAAATATAPDTSAPSASTPDASAAVSDQASGEPTVEPPKHYDPVRLTMKFHQSAQTIDYEVDINNLNVVRQNVFDATGVYVQPLNSSGDLNEMMIDFASGMMPDIFSFWAAPTNFSQINIAKKAAMEGVLPDLRVALEENAPTIKEHVRPDNLPFFLSSVVFDPDYQGSLYFLPNNHTTQGPWRSGYGFYIRGGIRMFKKEKILFTYLFVFLLMSIGAICWQLFIPTIATDYSVWNLSLGWQREIALWNVGIDVGIIYTLIRRNKSYAEILSIIVTILCIVLGTNHLFAAMTANGQNAGLHYLGTFEVLLFGGGFGMFALLRSGLLKNSHQ